MSNNSSMRFNFSSTTEEKIMGSSSFPPALIAIIFFQQVVMILACTGNGCVIFIVFKYLKLNKSTNCFIANLAVADFLAGIVAGCQMFYFLFPKISANKWLCFLRYQVLVFLTITSQITVTFTIFDRFIAICYNHWQVKIMSRRTTVAMTLGAWILAFFPSVAPFCGANKWSEGTQCTYKRLYSPWVYLAVSNTIIIFGLTAFVMYVLILKKAWKYHRRVKPSGNAVNKPLERDMRGAKVIGFVAIAFTVCWAPYTSFHYRYAFESMSNSFSGSSVSSWFVFLGMFNSIINPFIYAFQRKDFRCYLRKMFGCEAKNVTRSQRTTENL